MGEAFPRNLRRAAPHRTTGESKLNYPPLLRQAVGCSDGFATRARHFPPEPHWAFFPLAARGTTSLSLSLSRSFVFKCGCGLGEPVSSRFPLSSYRSVYKLSLACALSVNPTGDQFAEFRQAATTRTARKRRRRAPDDCADSPLQQPLLFLQSLLLYAPVPPRRGGPWTLDLGPWTPSCSPSASTSRAYVPVTPYLFLDVGLAWSESIDETSGGLGLDWETVQGCQTGHHRPAYRTEPTLLCWTGLVTTPTNADKGAVPRRASWNGMRTRGRSESEISRKRRTSVRVPAWGLGAG